jgi:zinc protease
VHAFPWPLLRRLAPVLPLLLAWLPAGPALGQPTPAAAQRVTEIEGIAEYRLGNGLQVLLYPDPTKPTVTVNVTYRVGSRMENYGETGMAHLLEHLMFKGSKHFPQPDKEFSARGFRNNGSTFFDRTNYFSTFKASDDNLRWALAQQADAMTESFIARKDLDSEMTVVRNEYELGENQPGSVLFKRLLAVMFDWHNYGKLPIGNRSDIENVGIPNLRAFYRLYYQPDNATLIVAGKFDPQKTLGWIQSTFGRVPKPARTLPPLWTVEPTQDGERSVVVRRKGDSQVVVVGYHIPAGRSRDTAALDVAAEVLGGTPNGRLHHELVESGLAAEVFADAMFLHDPGVLMFGALVKPGDSIERARDRLIEVVEGSFAKQAPTDAEIDRVRRDDETSAERALADPQEFGVALSDYVAQGDWRLFFVARDAVAAVASDQVAAAAGRYFRRDNRTVGMFIPESEPQRAEIPAPLPAAELLKDFKPRAAVAAGEAFDPSQANIDARTRRVRSGNLRLALLPKKTKGETVDVAMDFRFGDEKSLAGRAVARDLAGAMLGRGTATLTRQQIADEMTRLKMTGTLLDFQATRATLPDALRLSAQALREANFPDAEFEQLKRELLTSLQAKLEDPGELSRDALAAHFNTYPDGDPRHYIPLAGRIEAVKAITRDEVQAFYQQFWGGSNGAIAVVGDFDDHAAEPLVESLFGTWESKVPFAEVVREYRPVPPARIFVDTPDKENAFLRARIAFDLRDDDPDAPALILANEIFGGGSGLHNRLVDRIRQKEGLSYSIGSGLALNGRDRAAGWAIGAIAAPQNIDRVESAVRDELERMLKDGFAADEVEEAKKGFLQSRLVARSDDGTVAVAWADDLELDRTFEFSRQLEQRIAALTPGQLLEVVRRYLEPAKMTFVIAGDAKKGAR